MAARPQLSIISWNAGGIQPHAAQLKLYTEEMEPDVVCIQETWLRKDTRFELKGYSMEAKSRIDRRGGGVAIFIRETISYQRIHNIPHEIEGVTIKIRTTEKDINITSLYLPPAEHLDFDIIKPILATKNLIVCGDMNAKHALWGAPKNDPRGKQLGDAAEELELAVLNTGSGTRLNRDGTYSHLDVALASANLSLKCDWRIIDDDEWGSDHLPTLVTYNEPPSTEETHSI